MARYGWVYSEKEPNNVQWESTWANLEEGDTRLNQALEAVTIGYLAGLLVLKLPIEDLAKTAAGAILSAIPTVFLGSTTLYYTVYEYNAKGAMSHFCKKYSVWYFYDAAKEQLASHSTYYATSTPGA